MQNYHRNVSRLSDLSDLGNTPKLEVFLNFTDLTGLIGSETHLQNEALLSTFLAHLSSPSCPIAIKS